MHDGKHLPFKTHTHSREHTEPPSRCVVVRTEVEAHVASAMDLANQQQPPRSVRLNVVARPRLCPIVHG